MRVSLFVVLMAACLLPSCGGQGAGSSMSGGIVTPPPVQAASGFTNASLNGGYAFGLSGVSGSFAAGGSGVITRTAMANLTTGEETQNVGGVSCHVALSGTYTVNSNGTGTAAVTVTPDATSAAKGCGSGTANLSLALANGGTSLVLASQDASSVTVVTAIKQ